MTDYRSTYSEGRNHPLFVSETEVDSIHFIFLSSERGLRLIRFGIGDNRPDLNRLLERYGENAVLSDQAHESVIHQVREYFEGKLCTFSVDLDLQGTPFQRMVWRAVSAIPYGKTLSYGDIAREIGKGNAARALGRAVGANPVPLVIPCHRVIGKDGKLGGFSSGLDLKRKLLELEKAYS